MIKPQFTIAIIILGVADLAISKYFYTEGFGIKPFFEDNDSIMYKINDFILGTWLHREMNKKIPHTKLLNNASFILTHNVPTAASVHHMLEKLSSVGGHILRNGAIPSHGGIQGYITDPDNYIWEIVWNPAWKKEEMGGVLFKTIP